ncbi:uncharacterized protein LOC117641043 [Thrips palmi]|uniref:Uncharacterized protein LOC117641043 n=1 Tax=Thrips palmi TaxID=161013 RepID=A0A6P8Y3F2_THRPL|nr:uncharacterized protein LOC117641043 [Thrips palmi]
MVTNVLVVFLVSVAVGGVLGYPYPYPADYPDIGAVYSQYHAQDELGQYSFGYSGPSAAKHEQKTADGVTRGTYSYVDPLGRLQTRTYTADDVNGFRVAASDLPVGPAQPAAPEQLSRGSGLQPGYRAPYRWSITNGALDPAVEQPLIRSGFASNGGYVTSSQPQYYTSSAAYPVDRRYVSAPLAPYTYRSAAPVAPVAPVALSSGLSSQYHAQDEAGQYTFGYANDVASKSETKTLDGVTRGSYSYVDPNGQIQSRSYVADEGGFRVVASDLPQAQV